MILQSRYLPGHSDPRHATLSQWLKKKNNIRSAAKSVKEKKTEPETQLQA